MWSCVLIGSINQLKVGIFDLDIWPWFLTLRAKFDDNAQRSVLDYLINLFVCLYMYTTTTTTTTLKFRPQLADIYSRWHSDEDRSVADKAESRRWSIVRSLSHHGKFNFKRLPYKWSTIDPRTACDRRAVSRARSSTPPWSVGKCPPPLCEREALKIERSLTCRHWDGMWRRSWHGLGQLGTRLRSDCYGVCHGVKTPRYPRGQGGSDMCWTPKDFFRIQILVYRSFYYDTPKQTVIPQRAYNIDLTPPI